MNRWDAASPHAGRLESPLRLNRRRLLGALAAGTLAAAYPASTSARSLWDDEPGTPARSMPPADGPAPLPSFTDVERVEPWDALLFLAGRHPRYADTTIDSLMAFAPADILETMDTVVLDSVAASRGSAALAVLYRMIALEVMEGLLTLYDDTPVLLVLDAGHGGKRGVYYDPGSNGTEAAHTRAVVSAIEERAADPRYAGITIRRIFNDGIGDDFGLPPPEDRKGAAALTLRNVRAAMLSAEVDAWNRAHPDASLALHVLSVHFNAGSGGILVLHQGNSAGPSLVERSIAYARTYVASARPALNRSGLLPYQLALALGTGLSDDHVLYDPMGMSRLSPVNPYTGMNRTAFPRRYAMLQTSLLQRDYALGALLFHGLV